MYWGHRSKSRRQGFDGNRFIASCKGSFHCTNVDCPHIVEFNKPNRVQFTPKSNCRSCDKQAERVICNARKFWEFKKGLATVIIKHCGIHNCSPRKRAISTAADEFKKRPSTRPCELRKNVSGDLIRSGATIEEVEAKADEYLDRKQTSKIKKKVCSGTEFSQLADLRQKYKSNDKFLI